MEVVNIEAKAVQNLKRKIDDSFAAAVDMIYRCRGRVIVTGMGKSGQIARKIAATLASTGTAALFLHAAEGLHGDLGILRKGDLVLCVSKSGNTPELYALLPVFKRLRVPIIALTGKLSSALAKNADVVLDATVEEEACPHDLAPTASSTAALVLGDALAVALLDRRGFTKEDFALLHPGGNLGKQLLTRVEDVMYTGDDIPIVTKGASFSDVLLEMNAKRFGCVCVVKRNGGLAGIITDGDLKRILEKTVDILKLKAGDAMSVKPKVIKKKALAVEALSVLEKHDIMQIIVIDGDRKPVGMVHLHDLLEVGIV